MPTPTYTALANITLSSSASSVTFSSIPGTYRDLVLVCSITNASGGTNTINIRFNGDTGSNYNRVHMIGTGTADSVAFSNSTESLSIPTGGTGNVGTVISQIMDYSATDKHKTFLTRIADKGGYGDYVIASASRWANTSAVTSLTFYGTTNFLSGNSFALYGIVS